MGIQNDLILRTARGENTERPPVWLMRQAGRILPQYRKLRETVGGFKELVSNPDLICEVTLQPVDELGVDAAILFSDILVVPEAMGLPYEMKETKGPWFENRIASPADLNRLRVADPEESLNFVKEGIARIKSELRDRVPLIGFAGAPWTIFAYMVEGKGSKTFEKARTFLYRNPDASHALLDMITTSTISYLQMQVKAGVDIIQLFDSWAGILTPAQYKEFSLPYIEKICKSIPQVPKIVFPKGAFFALNEFRNISCQVVGVDWNMSLTDAQVQTGGKVMQGNLDPCLLFADRKRIREETIAMMRSMHGKHICNLGHGVYPDTPLDNVKCFVDTIREFRYNQ